MRIEPPFQAAVHCSGGGTTFQAVGRSSHYPGQALHGLVQIACLVVSRDNIGAIEKAEEFGMKKGKNIYVCRRKDFSSDDEFGQALLEIYAKHNIDFYSQLGWTLWTPTNVVAALLGLNQHPVTPEFFDGKGMRGLATHEAVLNYCRMTGVWGDTEAVAQLVDPVYDKGSVIMAEKVKVYDTDTAEVLQQRVLPVEHEVQINAWLKVASWMMRGRPGGPDSLAIERDLPAVNEDILAQAKAKAIETYPNG